MRGRKRQLKKAARKAKMATQKIEKKAVSAKPKKIAKPVVVSKKNTSPAPVVSDFGFVSYAKSKVYHVVVSDDGVQKTLCGDILSGDGAVDKVKEFATTAPEGKRLCKNCEKRQ